ncbi:phosphotransferase family protein [Pseudonocardia sp.]|jgi:aminoglycoside phosphotransferase (APT) family kinase protein|uniref:phosphotransferase family protein n=2 Tax=Pseudonocardia sp. TaxID=60912 RepID=UPI003D13E0C7
MARNGSPSEAEIRARLQLLATWMHDAGLGSGPVVLIRRLTGGSQNVLLHLQQGDREFVLRRPSWHSRSDSDRSILREARVLAGLSSSDVPHPRFIGACSDVEVFGAAFLLMARVPGVDADRALAGAANARHGGESLGLAVVDSLAALARIGVPAALSDLGKPEGWVARLAPRWRAQLHSYSQLPGYRGVDSLGDVDRIGSWLAANCPSSFRPGVVHGDFHIDNLVFDPARLQVAAIVDWELATIGDPLLDLAHLLATWPDGRDAVAPRRRLEHLPTAAEIIERYADVLGRDLTDLPWYRVVACYRLGVLLEGSKARADAGQGPVDIGARLHDLAVTLFDRARTLIDS